jgi:hypothetical protein
VGDWAADALELELATAVWDESPPLPDTPDEPPQAVITAIAKTAARQAIGLPNLDVNSLSPLGRASPRRDWRRSRHWLACATISRWRCWASWLAMCGWFSIAFS